MVINKHELVHTSDAGNGYHGYCQHCKAPLVTDLGYCSWDKLKCIDREANYNDLPSEVLSYVNFSGYKWQPDKKRFVRSTFANSIDHLTIEQMIKKVENILGKTIKHQ